MEKSCILLVFFMPFKRHPFTSTQALIFHKRFTRKKSQSTNRLWTVAVQRRLIYEITSCQYQAMGGNRPRARNFPSLLEKQWQIVWTVCIYDISLTFVRASTQWLTSYQPISPKFRSKRVVGRGYLEIGAF